MPAVKLEKVSVEGLKFQISGCISSENQRTPFLSKNMYQIQAR